MSRHMKHSALTLCVVLGLAGCSSSPAEPEVVTSTPLASSLGAATSTPPPTLPTATTSTPLVTATRKAAPVSTHVSPWPSLTSTFANRPFYGKYGTFFLVYDMCGLQFCNHGLMAVNDDGIWQYQGSSARRVSAPFFGERGTFPILYELFAVKEAGIFRETWQEQAFVYSPPVQLWAGPFYGNKKTSVSEVDGIHGKDVVAVNTDGVFVKRGGAGGTLGATERWTSNAFYGTRGTYLADVDGDGRADAIAVNDNGTTIRRSTGTSFAPNSPITPWLTARSRLVFFDVSAPRDGRADAVWFSDRGVYVYPSLGVTFGKRVLVTNSPFYGQRSSFITMFAGGGTEPDIDAAMVVNNHSVLYKILPPGYKR